MFFPAMAKVSTATENFYQNPKKFSVKKNADFRKKIQYGTKNLKKCDLITKFLQKV